MDAMPEPAVRREPPGTPPIVYLKGIAKYFPGVVANEDVDLEVRAGEIHALLGENGAGKSTLMNILTGIYKPDAGEIIIDGYARAFASPVGPSPPASAWCISISSW
jgi:simple sugar transport system ATP-binding protein